MERPGVNGVPPEMVRASDNRRPMATNRTKRPAVGIPASQQACNFLGSRPPALVHMGPGLTHVACPRLVVTLSFVREATLRRGEKADQENDVAL